MTHCATTVAAAQKRNPVERLSTVSRSCLFLFTMCHGLLSRPLFLKDVVLQKMPDSLVPLADAVQAFGSGLKLLNLNTDVDLPVC